MERIPREVITPHRKIPLEVPKGMTLTEFFNSPNNLRHLAEENGLLRSPEDLLLYRKAIGHSNLFDTSIILDTSQRILDPLGRPVRRDQLNRQENMAFSRMTQVTFNYMLEQYPDPQEHLLFCGEASLDATWPLCKPGVPSIRMIHNHFIVFEQDLLAHSGPADDDDPNLTDSGHHGLFLHYLSDVYHRFLEVLDLAVLKPLAPDEAQLRATGYPKGLPSWEVTGGGQAIERGRFWREYDLVLQGFLDFYRTFFGLVSGNAAQVPEDARFPDQIEDVLLFSNEFHRAARMVRLKVMEDPQFANELRWRPAYKQLLYRDDSGRLIVTISQNSVGNAITELLGIVVRRTPDEAAYAHAEPALINQLLELRDRLEAANLGTAVATKAWPDGRFVPGR
ncbi:MAG: hypothetical protein HQL82_08220 [Magnetococcales bacterium]|nr:hypothetical protein [Magnetococcales bacterium]